MALAASLKLNFDNGNKHELFQVLDVLRVDDKKFSVQLNMYFGVHWTESRLKLPKGRLMQNVNGTGEGAEPSEAIWLPVDLNFMRHLWVPNIFVYNLASFQALTCLEKLAGLWIIDNKNMFYNQVKRKEQKE